MFEPEFVSGSQKLLDSKATSLNWPRSRFLDCHFFCNFFGQQPGNFLSRRQCGNRQNETDRLSHRVKTPLGASLPPDRGRTLFFRKSGFRKRAVPRRTSARARRYRQPIFLRDSGLGSGIACQRAKAFRREEARKELAHGLTISSRPGAVVKLAKG